MLVNIERAIKNISEEIDFLQPLYEGIINAFEANADRIDINFQRDTDDKIIEYSIKDNGEGFTDENINSFLELWSDYKTKLGALGSGRIMCLKVFDNIIINSQTRDSDTQIGKKINIDFNKNFIPNSIKEIKPTENSSKTSETTTKFIDINDSYPRDKIATFNDDIKEEIFIRLLPMFIKFKQDRKEFKIFINDNLWLDTANLKQKDDDYQFKTKGFDIETGSGGKEKFKLTYRIQEDDKGKLEQFYGAVGRFITKFPKNTAVEKLKKGYSGIFCLTSAYLESRVKDSRNEFTLTFNQNNPSVQHPIVFNTINNKLKKAINTILKDKFSDIEDTLNDLKEELREEYPHLSYYINKNDNLSISRSNLIEEAEKLFSKDAKDAKNKAEKFINSIRKNINNFDNENYQTIKEQFSIAGKNKLAEYIAYRQTIINMLLEVNKHNKEKDIHNLFMEQNTTSNDSTKYANNTWIFDDKFMSYDYAASDKIIKQIINDVAGSKDIAGHDKNKKPDLLMFYSDDENNPKKNILLIEFKRLEISTEEKSRALYQLKLYPSIIREYVGENIGSVFAYTIIDIDDEFRHILTNVEGFSENAFGDKDNKVSAYYNYNKNVSAHLNVVSFSQLLQDASKRNTIFLDILLKKYEQ